MGEETLGKDTIPNLIKNTISRSISSRSSIFGEHFGKYLRNVEMTAKPEW